MRREHVGQMTGTRGVGVMDDVGVTDRVVDGDGVVVGVGDGHVTTSPCPGTSVSDLNDVPGGADRSLV